jgi:hypothetical protein
MGDRIKTGLAILFGIAAFVTFVVYPIHACGWKAFLYGDRAFFAAVLDASCG